MRISAPKSALFTTFAARITSARRGFNRIPVARLSSGTISLYGRYSIISYEIDFIGFEEMLRSIATVSLGGTLMEKLNAIAAAGFDGIEIFENDLLYFDGSPADVRRIVADLGLRVLLFQPFRDFEAAPRARMPKNFDRAEAKFDVMEQLGADLMLVCSNTAPDAIDDDAVAAEDLRALGERAARRGFRVGYEALAWGRRVNRFGHAWKIVQAADHAAVGLVVDTFHTFALEDDDAPIAQIPGDRIF